MRDSENAILAFSKASLGCYSGLTAFVGVVFLLALPSAAAQQCANIAGSWNATESGAITIALTASDGESDNETDPVSGSGVVTITQTGTCTFQYNPLQLSGSLLVNSNLTPSQLASLVRTVTVSGNSVTETGVFAILNTAAAGLTVSSVTGNVETGTGQVTPGNPTVMTLSSTADMVVTGTVSSDGETVSFTLTVTSSTTATFRAVGPIAIIPPSQTSLASGLAYNGLFTANGGSGASYTWCVLSGAVGSACLASGSGSPLPEGFSFLSSGLLSSTGTPPAAQGPYPFTVQVTDSAGDTQLQGFTLVIGCAVPKPVPVWQPLTPFFQPLNVSMQASFTPANGQTLDEAAGACGFSTFDWQQTITQSQTDVYSESSCVNAGGVATDSGLCSVPITPLGTPRLDPPSGGYTYEWGLYYPWYLTYSPNFATANPYYYSPSDIPNGCAYAVKPPNYGCLTPMSDGYTLNFYDLPQCSGCSTSLAVQAFTTDLVGVCESSSSACNSSGPSAPLYQWTWSSNYNGTSGGIFGVTTTNLFPADPASGTGGITVTSINGVPTPTVTVTPSATSITAAQGLTVTLAVSGKVGSPTATGSVTLTSGTYTSAATALSDGAATIGIPAGSLATGSNTLTAVYTPDNASAATFSVSSGFAQVTVTIPLTVTVTPSSTSILPAQALSVTISVSGGSGNPTPTGTVTLSSGSYLSAITSLTSGTATIVIPANSLSVGSNILTADYTPDSNSASTYGDASGTSAAVTVIQTGQTLQTITFGWLSAVTLGVAPFSISASASSGLPVSFSSTSVSICTMAGSTVTIIAAGTCSITAIQPGNAAFAAAIPVVQSFPVIGASQQLWRLSATFADGGTAIGYFVYDSSINAFSAWDMSTAGGNTNVFFPFEFTPQDSKMGFNSNDPTGLTMSFSSDASFPDGVNGISESLIFDPTLASKLSGTGGTINISPSVSGSYSDECFNCNPYRLITSGIVTTTVPLSPAVVVTPSSSSIATAQPLTVTVVVNGGSSNPPPTGMVKLVSGGYTSAAMTLSSGSAAINVPAGSLAAGVNTLTASYTPDSSSSSTYNSASGTASVIVTAAAKTTPTVTVTPSSMSITTAQALSVMVVVSGGSGNPTPTGSVALTSGTYTSATATLSNGSTTINVPAGTLATGSDTLTASYTPDSNSSSAYNSATGTNAVTVTTAVSPSFTISGTAITVTRGATTGNTSTVSVTPSGGFTGSVALAAALTSSPAAAQDLPTLNFGSTTPVSVTGSSSGIATLTISTTAATSAGLVHPRRRGVPCYAAGDAALAFLLFFGSTERRRSWRTMLGMLLLMITFAGGVLACGGAGGGGGSGGPTNNPGTTAGTYTVTITGTSGSTTEQSVITLTVE